VCVARCSTGQAGCCPASDCQDPRASCTIATSTCEVPVQVIPGLGDPCYAYGSGVYGYCGDSKHICTNPCNWTAPYPGCYAGGSTCQAQNQFPVGHPCVVNAQCPMDGTCMFNGTENVCTAPRSLGVGQRCRDYYSNTYPYPDLCVTGLLCADNNTYPYLVCMANATTPALGQCYNSFECVQGTSCAYNATYVKVCTPWVAPGGACDTSGLTCDSGIENCASNNPNQPDCGLFNTNCFCAIAPRTVEDGGRCNATVQCRNLNSECVSNSTSMVGTPLSGLPYGTCSGIIGKSCNYQSDCEMSSYYDPHFGTNIPYRYDCGCNRRCYLLNAPTPLPPYRAPTPYTVAVDPCQAKIDAWNLVAPLGAQYVPQAGSSIFTATYTNFNNIIPGLQTLANVGDQAKALALFCCKSCPNTRKFNVRSYNGWQLDCAAGTVRQLPDSCGNKPNLAILNCWATSSAAATGLGFVSMLVAALLL